MITVAVCDDNPQFAQILTKTLRELCALYLPERIDCKVLPSFGSANDVLLYLSNHSIDILFLDIDMPQTNGFQLAQTLNIQYPNTIIIFVSSYDNFVYSSFEYNPFRFLRKSHLKEELSDIVQKVIDKCIHNNEALTFYTTNGAILLRMKDILYLEGDKNYFTIYCVNNAQYRCRGTMSAAEDATLPYDFYRIHSAYVVNLNHIELIDEVHAVHMKDGKVINISRKKLPEFRELYMKFTRRRFLK